MTVRQSILFVHNGRGLGGAPKSLRYAIEACVKAGYTCSVACLECPDTNPYFRAAGAEVIVLDSLPYYTYSGPSIHKPGSKRFQEEREFAAQYAAFWRDLMGKHGPFSLVFINSMVLCDLIKPSQEAGSRVIQMVRETAQPGLFFEIMRGTIAKADAVLFISEYDRDLFSLNSTKVMVLPNSENPELFSCTPGERIALRKQCGLHDDDTVLIFTGGDGFIKGGDLMLEGLLRVNHNSRIVLLYAGYSGQAPGRGMKPWVKRLLGRIVRSPRFQQERTARLLSKIERMKSVRVKHLGFCRDIAQYYKMADVCMVPYREPHQARPIFEAGMAKIPCLVTDFPCFRDEVTDGDNGYLLPVSDPDAWARAIEKFIIDPDKRRQMGASNYQQAMTRHDVRRNAEKLLVLINGVLSA